MIAAGLVLIPVQAAQIYAELAARRVVRGTLPDGRWRSKPFVLLSTRLIEVRAFSDFLSEFTSALGGSPRLPATTKLVALGARPGFEFTAFQELHDRRVRQIFRLFQCLAQSSSIAPLRAEFAPALLCARS